jgi:two-component system chemotaxis response regulator CheB
LPTIEARADERLHPGTVTVAPPNRHLMIVADFRVRLADTDLVRFVRPAADVLFESVAELCGPRGLAVVLTGNGRDGADGVASVKRRGGAVIVQDPAEAEFPWMPEAAVNTGSVDFVLPLIEIAPAIVRLVTPEKQHG